MTSSAQAVTDRWKKGRRAGYDFEGLSAKSRGVLVLSPSHPHFQIFQKSHIHTPNI